MSMWITKGPALIRGRRLFDARHLLEEIRYPSEYYLCSAFALDAW